MMAVAFLHNTSVIHSSRNVIPTTKTNNRYLREIGTRQDNPSNLDVPCTPSWTQSRTHSTMINTNIEQAYSTHLGNHTPIPPMLQVSSISLATATNQKLPCRPPPLPPQLPRHGTEIHDIFTAYVVACLSRTAGYLRCARKKTLLWSRTRR
ncbi:hypothetical protein BC830DRAFT_192758 [Chytriomyces sp. MP71]|nr:hypothetical protein BC830DRAFT_192758 [Chytriomyces sp. MP71]